MKRGEVISAVQGAIQDESNFVEITRKHRAKNDPFNLVEFFQALPKKQHTQLWTSVSSLCEHCVQKLNREEDDSKELDQSQISDESTLNVLGGVVLLLQSAMATDDPVTPTPLRDTLQLLHDILLGPLEVVPDLQNSVSLLCEGWWCSDREERDGLVPHTLLYIIARSLTEGAIGSDVKRVWSMRQAFLLLDFEDPSVEPFKTMLLSATLQPLYLHLDEGRKFLSFLFGLHPSFVEDLHQTIKYQIPFSSKSLLVTYGEVYFRAWRLSSGPYLKQIEDHCIQDLMYSAVHAPRMGQQSLFHSLRKFLDQIHSQRMLKGVSEMLLRLYSPFLWRSLKVANPEVRANACTLLLDAFPLQDPDCNREEIDKIMQKQFDAMTDVLNDFSVIVRVTAVVGVCRVLSFYWEMIPAPVIKTLMGKLVKELVWDASAINVRVAVLQGLCIILENRLSHPLMQELLPLLQNLLHDSSEKVRIALLEMLLLIKGMRMIKFWHICPLEHLLGRVEIDSVHVVKRIVSLLIDSFQPTNVSSSQQIERCISLLRTNPGAARRFYQLAVVHLSPTEVTKFITSILSAVMQCVECEGVKSGGVPMVNGGGTSVDTDNSDDEDNEGDDPTGITKGGWARGQSGDQLNEERGDESGLDRSLCLEDTDVLCGLLETMVVLWEGVRDKLNRRGNKGTKRKLESRVSECLPQLFNTFKDGHSRSSLYLLASYLPKTSAKSIAMGTLTTLSAMTHPIKSQDYSSLLVALAAWEQTSHVIKLTNEWLAPELRGDTMNTMENGKAIAMTKNHRKGGKKRTKTIKSVSNGLPPTLPRQPLLAVEFINWMLSHPSCLQELKSLDEFWKLSHLLKNSTSLLEVHYLSHSPPNRFDGYVPSFDLLNKSLSLYIRICMHRKAEDLVESGKFLENIEEILVWSDRVLLPALNETTTSKPPTQPTRSSSRKRKAGQDHHPPPSPSHTLTQARKIATALLSLFSEILLLGLVSGDESETLEMELANFGSNVAKTSSAHTLLPSLSKLLYQLSETSTKPEVTGIPSNDGSLKPTATLLHNILSLLQSTAETKLELLPKAWGHVKQCICAVMVTSIRMNSLSSVGCERLSTFAAIVDSVLKSLVNHIKQNPSTVVPGSVEDLPELVSNLIKLSCKDSQSTSLFLSHLDTYLSESSELPPQNLLTHHASLCVINTLAARGKSRGQGSEFMMRCVRQSLKVVETCSEDEKQKWSEPLSTLTSLIQTIQDTLLYQ